MRQATFGLFICLALVATNASILEDLLNKTNFKGKLSIDTQNGLGLNYKGGLHIDSDYVNVDIAKFGASFNATPQDQSALALGNETRKAVNYSGSFNVEQGGRSADVAVNGTAGFASNGSVNPANKSQLLYATKLFNVNNWTVTTDDVVLAGSHLGLAGVKGRLQLANGTALLQQKFRGGIHNKGDVRFANDTEIGNFSYFKGGEGIMSKKAVANTNKTREHDPDFFYKTDGVFNVTEISGWKNDLWWDHKEGQANVLGVGWFKQNQSQNATSVGTATAERVNYQYSEVFGQNTTVTGRAVGHGVVEAVKGLGYARLENGTHGVIGGHKGRFNHWTVANFTNATDELRATVNGTWNSSFAGVSIPNEDNTSRTAKTLTKASWDLNGNDNFHGNWEVAGNRTVNASTVINTEGNSTSLEDIKVSAGREDAKLDEAGFLTNKFEDLMNEVRQY